MEKYKDRIKALQEKRRGLLDYGYLTSDKEIKDIDFMIQVLNDAMEYQIIQKEWEDNYLYDDQEFNHISIIGITLRLKMLEKLLCNKNELIEETYNFIMGVSNYLSIRLSSEINLNKMGLKNDALVRAYKEVVDFLTAMEEENKVVERLCKEAKNVGN